MQAWTASAELPRLVQGPGHPAFHAKPVEQLLENWNFVLKQKIKHCYVKTALIPVFDNTH